VLAWAEVALGAIGVGGEKDAQSEASPAPPLGQGEEG